MIPEGMRDVLPPETGGMRVVERTLGERFEAYGYREVRTPWLEFAETFETVDDDTLSAGYRLHGEQGHELMVRTDMTVPVARMAAERCDDWPLPLRFYYLASCVRPWAPQRGQDGEFVQAGVELLGLDSAAAEAECVALLCDTLSSLGLKEFTVTLGTVAFQRALIDSLGLNAADQSRFTEALVDRDYPLVESIAGKADLDETVLKVLWRVLDLSGTEDTLVQARKLARNGAMESAVTRLAEVRDLVDDLGFGDRLAFDFGLSHDLTYYSSFLLEAYAPGAGLPVATGGRYDGLVRRYGWDIPGVGFAIAVDRAVEAMEEAGTVPAGQTMALAFVGGLGDPARSAALRRAGVAVRALPDDAEGVSPPVLSRRGGTYLLRLADGRELSGSWRELFETLVAG